MHRTHQKLPSVVHFLGPIHPQIAQLLDRYKGLIHENFSSKPHRFTIDCPLYLYS